MIDNINVMQGIRNGSEANRSRGGQIRGKAAHSVFVSISYE